MFCTKCRGVAASLLGFAAWVFLCTFTHAENTQFWKQVDPQVVDLVDRISERETQTQALVDSFRFSAEWRLEHQPTYYQRIGEDFKPRSFTSVKLDSIQDAARFKTTYHQQEIAAETNEVVDGSDVTVAYDGNLTYTDYHLATNALQEPGPPRHLPPYLVDITDVCFQQFDGEDLQSHLESNYTPQSLQIRQDDGRIILSAMTADHNHLDTYAFDPQSGFALITRQRFTRGPLVMQETYTYKQCIAPSGESVSVGVQTETKHFGRESGELEIIQQRRVTAFEIAPDIQPGTFSYIFPRGKRVYDKQEKQSNYADGKGNLVDSLSDTRTTNHPNV